MKNVDPVSGGGVMLTLDSQSISTAVAEILRRGLLDPSRLHPEEIAYFSSRAIEPDGALDRGARTLYFNKEGRKLLGEMIEVVSNDKIVAQNLSIKEVETEVITTVFEAAIADDQGRLDVDNVVAALVERLEQGLGEWITVWPVLNLSMPNDRSIRLAGLTIGKVGGSERSKMTEDIEWVGRTVRIGRDGAPGSALPHIQKSTDETLASSECWGVGTIYGRKGAVEEVVEERVVIATDILRCFGMYIGIDPDETLLGIPNQPGIRRAIVYQRGQHVAFPSSIFQVPLRYELTTETLDRLEAFELFQRAQTISNAESATDLQQQILLGMMQFGLASRAASREIKIQSYITAIESLLCLERTEWKYRVDKAGKRLALFVSEEERASLRHRLKAIYELRGGAAHWAWRNLRGREFIGQADIDELRLFAYFAVLLALTHCEGLDTHAEFIAKLDAMRGVHK